MKNAINRYGLCCIHEGLRAKGFKFKTMTYSRFQKLGPVDAVQTLCSRYDHNLNLLTHILSECRQNLWCYRIPSGLFPLMTHPNTNLVWNSLPNNPVLKLIFHYIQKITANVRVSCHPDQFNVLASTNSVAVDNTIRELNHQGWVMDRLGCPQTPESPINIHINQSQGNIEDIVRRFKYNVLRLSPSVQSRLVVEVEDKGIWNAKNLVNHVWWATGLPVTFDYLHHKCNTGGWSEKDAFKTCAETWGPHKPLFHFAESMPGQPNPRKHADYPTYTPDTYGHDVDLDYEFKMKDRAIEKAVEILLTATQNKDTL